MGLKKPTIVIFDMDGTAVRHLNPRLLTILEKLDDLGYIIKRFFGWLFMRNRKGPIIPDNDIYFTRKKPRLLVHRAMHKLRRKSVEQIVEPSPGLVELLNFLKAQNIPLAIISSGLGKGYGHDILQKFKLDHYFKAAIFREDMVRSKPDPEPLFLALRKMGAKLNEQDVVWYIGDRHKDMTAAVEMAKHVPYTVEPIAYGVNAALALLRYNMAEGRVQMCFIDLLDFITGLFKTKTTEISTENLGDDNKKSIAV
ncbi:MAG: HAD-IA family hydrolase [Pseudomonadota bacterium]